MLAFTAGCKDYKIYELCSCLTVNHGGCDITSKWCRGLGEEWISILLVMLGSNYKHPIRILAIIQTFHIYTGTHPVGDA
jgi:hypothetical protein